MFLKRGNSKRIDHSVVALVMVHNHLTAVKHLINMDQVQEELGFPLEMEQPIRKMEMERKSLARILPRTSITVEWC
jgi:hypothetical protein